MSQVGSSFPFFGKNKYNCTIRFSLLFLPRVSRNMGLVPEFVLIECRSARKRLRWRWGGSGRTWCRTVDHPGVTVEVGWGGVGSGGPGVVSFDHPGV